MRARTVLTLTTGAALGAGATYLLDPEHGHHRRRELRRSAVRRARAGAAEAAGQARDRLEEVVRAAVTGYERGRAGEEVVVEQPRSVWRRLAG